MQHYKAIMQNKVFHSTCHKVMGRSEAIIPLILHLGTRWRWVVRCMTWLLYPGEGGSNNNMVSTINLHIVFIYGLFNNNDGSSDHTLPNYRIFSELWVRNDVEGSGCGLIWGNIQAFAQSIQGNHKKHQSEQLSFELRSEPQKYKTCTRSANHSTHIW